MPSADDTGTGQSPGLGNWKKRKERVGALCEQLLAAGRPVLGMSHTPCQQTARTTEVRHWGKAGENIHFGAWLGTREGRVPLMRGDARPQADGGLAVTVLSEGAHRHKEGHCFFKGFSKQMQVAGIWDCEN